MRIKNLALAIALAVPLSASANMEQQVNQMFGQLMNITGPGSYQTATRGVVTGGGVVLRNRISTANLISITAPSAKGGCGGINLYTGSFSFINGEEFVALMRNIASNAVGIVSGFAFEAALEYMDPSTANIIRNLANKIQQLNQMFSNSCQLASGIVSGGLAAFKERHDLKAATTAFVDNVAPDFFSAKSVKEGSAAGRLLSAGKIKPCVETGNVVWCALKKTGLASQIMFGSDENAEFIMSMTGSHIISVSDDGKGDKNTKATPVQATIRDKALSLFVDGAEDSELKVWSCDADDNDQCLEPSPKTLGTFKGLKQRMIEDIRNSGAFERFAVGNATPADGNRIKYLATSSVGANLFKVIQKAGADAGHVYFEEFAQVIALNAAYSFVMELLDLTYAGVSAVEFPEAEEVKRDIRDTRQRLSMEWTNTMATGTNFRDADRRAAEILKMAPVSDPGKLPQGTQVQSAGN